MKTFFKTAFIICLCVLFLSSCTDIQTDNSSTESEEVSSVQSDNIHDSFSFAYNSTSPLNPFTTDSFLNISLSQLITESLVFINADGETEKVLLESIVSENDNTVYKLKIKENRSFFDGTAITYSDVISSVNAILSNKNGYYYSLLRNVQSAIAEEDGTVVFTLKLPDPFFERNLVFPIIKNGSKDEDYIGSGAYVLLKEEGTLSLKANGDGAVTKTINLVPTDNALKLHTMLQTGSIDYYYTKDPSIVSGSFSGSECVTDQTGMLLFNTAKGVCADRELRYLLSKLIDRERIISESELFAESYDKYTFFDDESITVTLEKYLDTQGYNRIDDQGFRYKKSGGKNLYFEIKLACIESKNTNKVAKQIEKILSQQGIKTVISSYSTLEKLVEVTAPRNPTDEGTCFDMAVTELNITPNGDIACLFDAVNGYTAALSKSDLAFTSYLQYLRGEITLEEFENGLNNDFFVMSLYRCKAKTLYNRLFAEGIEISPYTPYYEAHKWYIYE